MVKIEQRISAIAENAGGVATICEADLRRRVVYSTRARIMLDGVAGITQLPCHPATGRGNN